MQLHARTHTMPHHATHHVAQQHTWQSVRQAQIKHRQDNTIATRYSDRVRVRKTFQEWRGYEHDVARMRHSYMYTRTHAHMHTHVHIRTRTHMCTHTHTRTHTHSHTHSHTHTHAHAHTPLSTQPLLRALRLLPARQQGYWAVCMRHSRLLLGPLTTGAAAGGAMLVAVVYWPGGACRNEPTTSPRRWPTPTGAGGCSTAPGTPGNLPSSRPASSKSVDSQNRLYYPPPYTHTHRIGQLLRPIHD